MSFRTMGRSRTRSTITVAAGVTVAALVIAGCSNAVPGSSGSGGASGSGAASATVGNKLTVAVPAPATGINPASVNTAFGDFAAIAYEPLIRLSPGGKYTAGLAQSWKVAAGNKSMTLTLRDNVTFADGTPVTAAAVKASLDYCASKASVNRQTLKDLESVTTSGEHEVTVTLKEANPLFESMLSQKQGCGMIISPAGLKDPAKLTVDATSAGAGPYIYQPGQSVSGDTYTYTANPKYFDKARQHYKTIVLKVMAQPQAALNALTTGQVDLANGDLTTAKQVSGNKSLQVAWTPFVWSGLNLIDRGGQTTKAMGDVRVRQAINYAIDRKSLTTALLGQFGVPTDQPSVKGTDGWSQEAADVYSYNPTKAKQLMAQAGYSGGFDLPVISVAFGGLDTLTTALTPMLAKIGVRLKVKVATDEKTYLDGQYNHRYSASAVGYGSGPMYSMGMGLVDPTALPFNGFGTNDPKANTLLAKLRTASADQQGTIAQELNLYLVRQAWFAPVAFGPVLYYGRSGLGGLSVDGKHPTISVLDVYNKS